MQGIVQMAAKVMLGLKSDRKIPVDSGINTADGLFTDIKKAGYRSVFIASGKTIRNKGMLSRLISNLNREGIKTVVFSDIVSDPTIENVESGLKVLKERGCDCVIAAGGGSVLDCAKVIALRATNPLVSVRMMTFYLTPCRRSLPLYAIPTTSGTGSEITYFSVITDTENKKKFPVVSDKFLPDKIVFDYELLRHVPKGPTVNSGMDALTHCIESYISTYSDHFKEDTALAPEVCRDICKYLPVAAVKPENREARLKMAWAAYKAGLCFRRAAVGYVHAIAHRLGETYGIPHGLACAAVLPHVLEKSLPEAEQKLKKLALDSGISDSAEGFIEEIVKLERSLGITGSFEEINKADYPLMIKRSIAEASLQGCPAKLDYNEVENILVRLKTRTSE